MIFRKSLYSFLGNWYFTANKKDKAKELYEKAVAMDCKNATVYLNYSIILILENQAENAAKYLKRADELSTSSITSKNVLVTASACYYALGNYSKAIELAKKAIPFEKEKNSDVSSYVLIGYSHFAQADLENALEYTQKALDILPESGAAWDNLGQIYYSLSDYIKSKEAFLKSVGFDEDFIDSYYGLGLIAFYEGNKEKALEYFEYALTCEETIFSNVTKDKIKEISQNITLEE